MQSVIFLRRQIRFFVWQQAETTHGNVKFENVSWGQTPRHHLRGRKGEVE